MPVGLGFSRTGYSPVVRACPLLLLLLLFPVPVGVPVGRREVAVEERETTEGEPESVEIFCYGGHISW